MLLLQIPQDESTMFVKTHSFGFVNIESNELKLIYSVWENVPVIRLENLRHTLFAEFF